VQRAPAGAIVKAPLRATAFAVLALAAASHGCGSSDGVGADSCAGKSRTAGRSEVVLSSGGRERRMIVDVPESAVRGEPAPLVVLFHGANGTAEVILATTGVPEKGTEVGYITVAGDGIEKTWNAGSCCNPAAALGIDDVGFTRDMVRAISDEFCIDPERVYATGFSNGAAMVFRLACEASDLFAAFAPVAGGLVVDCDPARVAPIHIIQNLDDPIVPFVVGEASFNRFQIENACSGEPVQSQPAPNTICETASACADDVTTRLCAVDGTSHVWPGGATDPADPYDATDAVWEFFEAQPPCTGCGTSD
jgi:polyhydroxybutyrate depolymerase